MGANDSPGRRETAALLATLVSEPAGDVLRRDSLSWLVERQLARTTEASSLADIGTDLEHTYRLQYPPFRLEEVMVALEAQGHVRRVRAAHDDHYVLAGDRAAVVRAQLDANERFFDSVIAQWLGGVRERHAQVTEADEPILVQAVTERLGVWVERYGFLATVMFRTSAGMLSSEGLDLDGAVGGKWQAYGDEWQGMATATIAEFFNEPTPLRQQYLDRVFESYAELFLQYVEKTEGASPFGMEPREQLVLLDTNAVLALLGYGAELEGVCKAAVEASRSLGMTVAMTTRTKQEFLRLLDSADNLYRSMCGPQRVRPEVAVAATVRPLDNVFIGSFLRERGAGRQGTWAQFCARARQVADLLKAHGVETESLLAEAVEGPRHSELDSLVGRFSPRKGSGTREHDVFHYLAVRKWRRDMGSHWACWLLTLDTSLPFFDYEARKSEAEPGVAFCMAPSCWLAWLRRTTPARLKGASVAGVGAAAFHLPFHRAEANAAAVVRLIAATEDWRDSADVILAAANDHLLQQEARKAWGDKDPAVRIDQALTETVARLGDQRSEDLKAELAQLRREKKEVTAQAEVERREWGRREEELRQEAAQKGEEVAAERGRADDAEKREKEAADREKEAADREKAALRTRNATAAASALSVGLAILSLVCRWPTGVIPIVLLPLVLAAACAAWRRSVSWGLAVAVLGVGAAIVSVLRLAGLLNLPPERELLWHGRIQVLLILLQLVLSLAVVAERGISARKRKTS